MPDRGDIRLLTRRATRRLGYTLGDVLAIGDLVLLEGDLGAGKTFLVRAISRALGVPADLPITSPTFELVHELPARFPLIHADLYRLSDSAQLTELGLVERVGRDAVVLVEWGDRFATDLGTDSLRICLRFRKKRGGRMASISSRGVRGAALLSELFSKLESEFGSSKTLI
jgi:tRNA threonylcarbamoyladenosine biosynthesis protein TsaE